MSEENQSRVHWLRWKWGEVLTWRKNDDELSKAYILSLIMMLKGSHRMAGGCWRVEQN